MPKIQLSIPSPEAGTEHVEVIDTADLNAALAVLDINLREGCAEILADGIPLARLKRCGRNGQPFWEIARSDAGDRQI
ncbi:MAG: hypothetical protein ACR2FJ_06810 [Qipengyuania sp.]